MRHFLPWLLLGVLGLGVVAAAAAGQVESPGIPAVAWVNDVVATTAAAGSAQLRFSSVTAGPVLFQRSGFVGRGVIDFANGDNRITQLNHQVASESTNGGPARPIEQTWTEESIAIGQTVYRKDLVALSGHAVPTPWVKSISPRALHQAFGLDVGTGAEDAVAGLAGIEPIEAVQTLGPGSVDGVSSTRYRITNAPIEVCVRGRTASLPLIPPTTIWVDHQGRLVQTQVTTHSVGGQLPASVRTLIGGPVAPLPASTTVTTLTFSDFGAPVHIVAPKTSGPEHPKSISLSPKGNASNGACGG